MGKREEVAQDVIEYLDEVSNGDYRSMMEVAYTALTQMALHQHEKCWPHAKHDVNYVAKAYERHEENAWKLRSLDPATATMH